MDPDKARERHEQQEDDEMAVEARTEQVRRYTPEPVIPRSIVESFADVRARLSVAMVKASQVEYEGANELDSITREFIAVEQRLERFAPSASIPISDALEGVGPSESRRRMEAIGAVLAERLPEIVYVAPERLRAVLAELLAAADTGI